jgi:hypothetical protein
MLAGDEAGCRCRGALGFPSSWGSSVGHIQSTRQAIEDRDGTDQERALIVRGGVSVDDCMGKEVGEVRETVS